eukprot:scaffold138981_cov26-Cyclotella_meneghiniana.AAC.1
MKWLSRCCLRAREKPGAYDGTAKRSEGFGGNVAEDPVVNAIGDYNNRRAEELSLPPTTIPMIESTEC